MLIQGLLDELKSEKGFNRFRYARKDWKGIRRCRDYRAAGRGARDL